MNPRNWFRRKPEKPLPPPPLQFDIPIIDLPAEAQAKIRAGACCKFRQYPAERISKNKFRSGCVVLVDDEYAGETMVTWEENDTPK